MNQLTAALIGSFLMAFFDSLSIPIIPIYALQLGASQFDLGLIAGFRSIFYAVFAILLGRLREFLSIRVLMVSFAGYGIVYLSLCLFNISLLQLSILMILLGVCGSLFWPFVEILLGSPSSSTEKLASNFGVSWSGGAIIGSFAAGFALELHEFDLVFMLISIASIIFALTNLSLIMKREKDAEKIGRESTSNSGINRGSAIFSLKWTWLSAYIYASTQGIIFSLFPAYAELKGIPGLFIGLIVFSIMLGRTLTFAIFDRIPVKIKDRALEVGIFLILLGSIPIPLTADHRILLVTSFLLGLGTGLTYLKALQMILVRKEGIRFYTGVFEGVIGAGFSTSLLAGFLADLWLEAPYILILVECISTLPILMKRKM